MPSFKLYIPLVVATIAAIYGYGLLNGRVNTLEAQAQEQRNISISQGVLLQTIAIDVAVIRTKVELAIKK